MRINRFYTDAELPLETIVELPSDVSGHIHRVLRMKEGEQIQLFNGDGFNYLAILTQVGKRVEAQVTHREANDSESPFKVHLVQAIARGERMDYVIQKAVELGVASITPMYSERVQFKLDAKRQAKKQAHWQKVIASACEQSGRSVLPILYEPLSFNAYLASVQSDDPMPTYLADPEAGMSLPRKLTHLIDEEGNLHSSQCRVLVGPEGGFTPEEILELVDHPEVQNVTLGPRILRTETAGLTMLSILQAALGDLT